MIQPERIQVLHAAEPRKGDYVLYWMQAAQRAWDNHALEYALGQANALNKPLLVLFGLTEDYPHANLRHFAFMLEGLKETQNELHNRGLRMIIQKQSPELAAVAFAQKACLVVADRGYLAHQRHWQEHLSQNCLCPVVQVETDVVVPLQAASNKEEYAAATYRPKVQRLLDTFLVPIQHGKPKVKSLSLEFPSFDIQDTHRALAKLHIDCMVGPVEQFRGGASQAQTRLDEFVKNRLDHYDQARNDPNKHGQSDMSPYLHFGQISPLKIALKIAQTNSPGKKPYLEELIVRRELAMNFALFNPHYLTIKSIPNWARIDLREHKKDKRQYIYTLKQFEMATTHDPYWNAAQREMVLTGKMHGYMRMYWGKKILEWCRTPQYAYKVAVYLNDKYELDGRDPNGYAGIAWCFGKHDRPWQSRPIFGKVRYMNDNGLKRKFDIDAYAQRIEQTKII